VGRLGESRQSFSAVSEFSVLFGRQVVGNGAVPTSDCNFCRMFYSGIEHCVAKSCIVWTIFYEYRTIGGMVHACSDVFGAHRFVMSQGCGLLGFSCTKLIVAGLTSIAV
jgi:hypothetical protein